VAIAVVPLAWILWRTDLRRVLANAHAVSWAAMAATIVISLLGIAAGSLRLRLLLLGYGAATPPSVSRLFRDYLVGMYYAVLPTGVAGDAIRGYRLSDTVDAATSYTAVLVERLMGLVALLLIATAALLSAPLRHGAVAASIKAALSVGAAGAVTLLGLVVLLPLAVPPERRRRLPLLGALLGRIPPPRTAGPLLLGLVLSLFTQGAPILCVHLILRELAPGATLLLCAQMVPFVLLLTFIPLTPAGIGQRELLYVYFLGLGGVRAEAAITLSLVVFALGLSIAALGGGYQLLERWTRRRAGGSSRP